MRAADGDPLPWANVVRGLTDDGEVLWDELAPWEKANEALTGVAVVPVSVIGPVPISLGEYELREPDGDVGETGRICSGGLLSWMVSQPSAPIATTALGPASVE